MPTGYSGSMYGTEYDETFSQSQARRDDDVPCAVCQAKSAISVMMIPAKTTCPVGWTVQYSGFLGAGYYGHPAASQYICVDKHPDHFEGGGANLNGKLIYSVRGFCGSLPCPPYQNNRILPCVVCSQ